MSSHLVTLDQIAAAAHTIKGRVHRTGMTTSTYLSSESGMDVYLKLELFQKTGSFKVRGVSNKMASLTDEEKRNGVVTLSAGNHAQAVAWGATQYGIPSTVCMPATSLVSKQEATQEYGGQVVLVEGSLIEKALSLQNEHNLYLVHPFDDPTIIAGHATLGAEIIEDVPDVDVVLVSIGGGGLISGVAAAVKQLKPDVKVYGIEPDGAPGMTLSLAKGEPVTLGSLNTVADGLAAPFVGKHNLAHVQAFVDEVVTVTDEEILWGLKILWERCKLAAEPAAGAPIAALLKGKFDIPAGSKVVSVVCGGNVNLANFEKLF